MDDTQFGASIRAVRLRRAMTQEQLAAAAGVSRPIVSLIERGRVEETSVRTVRQVAAILGVSVTLNARWRGAEMAKLLDEAHSALVGSVVKRLTAAGWIVRPEHTFSVWGERGSIDVLAWHPSSRALLCIECKTKLPDLQDVLSTMDRKRRLAREIAKLEGWDPAFIGSVLVVCDQKWARNAVRRSGAVFDAALPARTVEVRRWLACPSGDLRAIWFLANDSAANTGRRSGGQMRANPRRGAHPDRPNRQDSAQ
ncbi:MAG TPA: helix-turn-helix domain-containing protein [Candidatus Limnocylindrales bacterium]